MTLLDILHKVPEFPIDSERRYSKEIPLLSLSPGTSARRNPTEETKENFDTRSRSPTQTLTLKNTENFSSGSTKKRELIRSAMAKETFRLLKQDRQDIYKDYDKQVEKLGLRPFDKAKFERKSFNPANVLRKIPFPKNDKKQAFLDFFKEGGKKKEEEESNQVPVEPKELIKGSAFHGRKWKHHMSKARISNFGPKENYSVLVSTTHAGVTASRKKLRIAERKELDKVKDNLELDVASSQEKYLTNLLNFNALNHEIYGEKLTKYLDLINYEKANYNAVDGSRLEEAYELVNIIYKGRENKKKSQIERHKKTEESLYDDENDKNRDEDQVYKKPIRTPPPSKIHIRRNSITSFHWHAERESSPVGGQSPRIKMKRAAAMIANVAALKALKIQSIKGESFPQQLTRRLSLKIEA